MKKSLRILGIVGLIAFALAGCALFGGPDLIIGSWQQVSVNGSAATTVNVAAFTATTYSYSIAGATMWSGTWTKSGSSYSLNGAFLGFISSTSTITPTFSSSNNTLTYTGTDGNLYVYNRQ
jgi:hypothetical protein